MHLGAVVAAGGHRYHNTYISAVFLYTWCRDLIFRLYCFLSIVLFSSRLDIHGISDVARVELVCSRKHSAESALPVGANLVSDEPCPAPNGLVNKENVADRFITVIFLF